MFSYTSINFHSVNYQNKSWIIFHLLLLIFSQLFNPKKHPSLSRDHFLIHAGFYTPMNSWETQRGTNRASFWLRITDERSSIQWLYNTQFNKLSLFCPALPYWTTVLWEDPVSIPIRHWYGNEFLWLRRQCLLLCWESWAELVCVCVCVES